MIRLPLEVISDPMECREMWTLVVDANGDVVADCCVLGRSQWQNEKNAALIVRAVNAQAEPVTP